ncbi:MAG: Nramp family divalent metal transporter [Lutibacter sp.]|nr:Nramp family divalent metal transporter [Lutibacter sp.]
MVAAAFIGPGTVTVCTLAGVSYGYQLLWAMTLSIVATIVLQEMAARIGIITQQGLATLIKDTLPNPALKKGALFLILSAIVLGNAAYEAGNITGASLGLTGLFGGGGDRYYPLLIGLIAFGLLYIGNYRILERCLIGLVLLMSVSFLLTAMLTKPDVWALLKGMFVPVVPSDSLLTIIALIGTTVVPYNLFLHAALVKEKWQGVDQLPLARKDTVISIVLGGLVSMGIMVAASAIETDQVKGIADLAKGLQPLYGRFAGIFLGIGLFAAGITSTVTAPLAAAYVASNCFGWKIDLKGGRFRASWMLILLTGIATASLEISPIELIRFAQVANGLLLPVIVLFLWWIVNRSELLGDFKNTRWQNILTAMIVLGCFVLGIKSIAKVLALL